MYSDKIYSGLECNEILKENLYVRLDENKKINGTQNVTGKLGENIIDKPFRTEQYCAKVYNFTTDKIIIHKFYETVDEILELSTNYSKRDMFIKISKK
jgi:hypothetical protein